MTLDKVSKNAFVEPIQALQNYYTKNLKDLSQNQNNTCIFAVRGFIDSLRPLFFIDSGLSYCKNQAEVI